MSDTITVHLCDNCIGVLDEKLKLLRDDAERLQAELRAKIVGLEAEAAGRALMDAEGEAFLPEVVTQLRAELQEAVGALGQLVGDFPLYDLPLDFPEVESDLRAAEAFLAKHT